MENKSSKVNKECCKKCEGVVTTIDGSDPRRCCFKDCPCHKEVSKCEKDCNCYDCSAANLTPVFNPTPDTIEEEKSTDYRDITDKMMLENYSKDPQQENIEWEEEFDDEFTEPNEKNEWFLDATPRRVKNFIRKLLKNKK